MTVQCSPDLSLSLSLLSLPLPMLPLPRLLRVSLLSLCNSPPACASASAPAFAPAFDNAAPSMMSSLNHCSAANLISPPRGRAAGFEIRIRAKVGATFGPMLARSQPGVSPDLAEHLVVTGQGWPTLVAFGGFRRANSAKHGPNSVDARRSRPSSGPNRPNFGRFGFSRRWSRLPWIRIWPVWQTWALGS